MIASSAKPHGWLLPVPWGSVTLHAYLFYRQECWRSELICISDGSVKFGIAGFFDETDCFSNRSKVYRYNQCTCFHIFCLSVFGFFTSAASSFFSWLFFAFLSPLQKLASDFSSVFPSNVWLLSDAFFRYLCFGNSSKTSSMARFLAFLVSRRASAFRFCSSSASVSP